MGIFSLKQAFYTHFNGGTELPKDIWTHCKTAATNIGLITNVNSN